MAESDASIWMPWRRRQQITSEILVPVYETMWRNILSHSSPHHICVNHHSYWSWLSVTRIEKLLYTNSGIKWIDKKKNKFKMLLQKKYKLFFEEMCCIELMEMFMVCWNYLNFFTGSKEIRKKFLQAHSF